MSAFRSGLAGRPVTITAFTFNPMRQAARTASELSISAFSTMTTVFISSLTVLHLPRCSRITSTSSLMTYIL
jgi:hypothetical protein